MKIPLADLRSLHHEIKDDLQAVFDRVLENSSFILGPEVRAFEADFAAFVGSQNCVAVNSGTAALHLALAALGVGPGDEVITVAHTFIATAEAISAVGAKPVFIDVDAASYTMDPSLIEAAITPRTRAIIPVHLYGQIADMDAILAIASMHGIPVIEDVAQAHGATYKGRNAGSIGTIGCFSFFPGKNLGALGEGGAITTNDPELARQLRMWREHGSSRKYEHHFPAFNMRMEGLQGGFLAVKLKHLDRWNSLRRAAAASYHHQLQDSGLTLPVHQPGTEHVYHLFVVQSDDRVGLRTALAESEIESGLHYPTPLHLQEAYRSLGMRRGDLPVTERAVTRILSLPIYPGISEQSIARVSEVCMSFSRAPALQ